MRILVAAAGKIKDGEESGMIARYSKRFDQTGRPLGLGPLSIVELPESRAATVESRKGEEAERLLRAAAAAGLKIALHEGGHQYQSKEFAKLLSNHASGGVKTCAFLIGGPDGHGETLLKAVDVTLSLGPMTLPHGLARVVLIEQLYRAATILAGHPYHRA
jgi:23S rRNA (pseudouridine1915-N3)-methyltransferase